MSSERDVALVSFQRLPRVAQLDADGVLVGAWDHVMTGSRDGYRAMVAAMAQVGVDTQGRPPIWTWRGEVTLLDAYMLFNAEHELSTGYAAVELAAPADLVVGSDYGAWNDYLSALRCGRQARWPPPVEPRRQRSELGVEPEQACLPYLRVEWVREVRPLPTACWDELDLNRRA